MKICFWLDSIQIKFFMLYERNAYSFVSFNAVTLHYRNNWSNLSKGFPIHDMWVMEVILIFWNTHNRRISFFISSLNQFSQIRYQLYAFISTFHDVRWLKFQLTCKIHINCKAINIIFSYQLLFVRNQGCDVIFPYQLRLCVWIRILLLWKY